MRHTIRDRFRLPGLALEAARAICQATPDEDAGDVGGVGVQNNWAEQVP